MPKLHIIRGLPGSGKSTMAKALEQADDYLHTIHIETDQYFIRPDGFYDFDPALLKRAHKWCQDEARFHLENEYDVIVSNTFTQRWEVQPYIDMAKELGAKLTITVAKGKYKNIHDVPEEVIEKMKARWEEIEVC